MSTGSPLRHRDAEDERLQTLTVSSKGQITISQDARRKLGIDQGTHLLEIVVGDCLLYVPEHAAISRIFESIDERLRRKDVTVDMLLADVEAHRSEVMREFYPDVDFGDQPESQEHSA